MDTFTALNSIRMAAASTNSTTDDGFSQFSGALNNTYVIAIVILSFIAVALSTVLFAIYYSVSTKKKEYAALARNNPDKPIARPPPAAGGPRPAGYAQPPRGQTPRGPASGPTGRVAGIQPPPAGNYYVPRQGVVPPQQYRAAAPVGGQYQQYHPRPFARR